MLGRQRLATAIALVVVTASLSLAGPSATADDATAEAPGYGVLGTAYQRTIDVHNNGSTLDDAVVTVTWDTAREIDHGHLEPDCSDVRIALKDAPSRSLDHDIQDCNTNTTRLSIKSPDLEANQPGPEEQLSLHYGQPALDPATTDLPASNLASDVQTRLSDEQDLTQDTDQDTDAVPDTLEETLCSRSVENTLVRKTGPITGDCDTQPADYTPTPDEVWFISPSLANPGADADGDGIPATVIVEYTRVELNTTEPDPVDVFYSGARQEILDWDDTDPNKPSGDEICTLVDAPSGTTSLALGADEDGDGVPNGIVLSRAEVCVDTNDDGGVFVRPVEGSFSATLDPDDEDTSVPTGNTVESEPAARNATFSPDKDGDGLVCNGFIGYTQVTLHRDTHTYTTDTWTNKRPYDAAHSCQGEDIPTHSTLQVLDADRDGIPDASEDDACDAQNPRESIDGWCNDIETDYRPPESYPGSCTPPDIGIDPCW